MIEALRHRLSRNEESGAVLVLFAFSLIVFVGVVAMSIDVGRYVWARTQMQAAVDAAALAAAQSMPSTSDAATNANAYWLDNSSFIRSQGTNVTFAMSYPPGNKRISIRGDADIPTWFARVFGIDSWHVSAEGDAESQVLDISVVLDISGSMCFDSFKQTETSIAYQMSPGRLTPAGGYAFPRLAQPIAAGGPSSITITLNDVRIFTGTTAATNRSNFGTTFNSTTPYRSLSSGSSLRAGMILIDQELFKITAANAGANQLTVTRAQTNDYTGTGTANTAHAVNAEVWANRTGYSSTNNYCELASRYQANGSQNGPHMPFDAAVSNAQYFTTLFEPAYDKIGLASYSNTATNLQGLTSNLAGVASTMDTNSTMYFPTGGTNIAHGLATGRFILDGAGKRSNAVRVMVLLTDGIPTHYCSNAGAYTSGSTACTSTSGTTPTSCASTTTGMSHAYAQATAAANADIIVFVIGLGNGVIDCILQQIAANGGGAYYKAPTSADLDDAFQAIAEQTHIALVR